MSEHPMGWQRLSILDAMIPAGQRAGQSDHVTSIL
jgi:hypothetical protein